MAPEVALKMAYDFKADLWSVGIILYELLTLGGHPFWNKAKDNRKTY